MRFAILTTLILILSYGVALTVISLERVLAYVGSTGSTSISFILPGLFYYKISDPESIHQQRLAKEDDDANSPTTSDADEEDGGLLGQSTGSLHSAASAPSSGVGVARLWPWRKRLRRSLDNMDPKYLRRGALALAIYGFLVMTTCLILNMFVSVAH